MTMQMVGPYLTTTRYNSKKKKPNAKQIKAQAEHDKWLRKNNVHPDQLAARNTGSVNEIPDNRSNSKNTVPTSDRICGHGPAKQPNTYSGERKLLGIATMHKSNMVPIFADKKQDAKDIASMRR